jgi:hypothetical protein
LAQRRGPAKIAANKEKPVNDGERFEMLLSQIAGRDSTYSALAGKDSLPVEAPF